MRWMLALLLVTCLAGTTGCRDIVPSVIDPTTRLATTESVFPAPDGLPTITDTFDTRTFRNDYGTLCESDSILGTYFPPDDRGPA